MTFRTSSPPTYLLPVWEEMREAANQVGLKSFSRDLATDLINLAAGGAINPPGSYRSQVLREVEQKLPAPDSDGEWKLRSGSWTKSREEAVMDRLDGAMRYHQNVCDFLQTVDLGQFPGYTPLQQAMSLLELLSKKQGGSGDEEGGEPLPIFTNGDGDAVAKELQDAMDQAESLDQAEQELLDPDDGQGQNSDNNELSKLKVAEDFVSRKGYSKILEVSRHLDTLSKLRVRRKSEPEVDPDGDEVRSRPIKGLSELARVNKTAWATKSRSSAYFLYQAVSGQLTVRERIRRSEQKQILFILLDGSGSMDNGQRHFKATGVVMNRLKAVVQGDAEVHLAVFDERMYEPQSARTPAEAKALMQSVLQQNFSGWSTDIARAIRSAEEWIEKEMEGRNDLYRPEIVVLTDDDSSISSISVAELKGTKVHGFAMEERNKSLVDFCKSTGGVGVDNM